MKTPSQTHDRYWLFAVNDSYVFKKPRAERDSGKWLLFDSISAIDSYWLRIGKAVQEGRLGPSAKVSTAKDNPNAKNPLTRVICIFTEDFNDREDVRRVERELRALGIKNRLVYKLDKDVGRYSHQGVKDLVKLVSEELTE